MKASTSSIDRGFAEMPTGEVVSFGWEGKGDQQMVKRVAERTRQILAS